MNWPIATLIKGKKLDKAESMTYTFAPAQQSLHVYGSRLDNYEPQKILLCIHEPQAKHYTDVGIA